MSRGYGQILSYSGMQICTAALDDNRAEYSKMSDPHPMTQQVHFLVPEKHSCMCTEGMDDDGHTKLFETSKRLKIG